MFGNNMGNMSARGRQVPARIRSNSALYWNMLPGSSAPGMRAVVGSPAGTPLIFDVSQPLAPVPVGGMLDDGYTHDSLCPTYRGADKPYKGHEICFNFNEDTVTLYDITANPMMPEQLARVTYENASYTHSGALTKDHTTLISTDEGDEPAPASPRTARTVSAMTMKERPFIPRI